MFSVALIGPDGAGKTTIARLLEERSPLPLKYIYMGVNIAASNFALPTSRFIEYVRGRSNGDSDLARAQNQASPGTKRRRKSMGRIFWSAARLANNLADEWYRQLWSWGYQRRGYIALYDRHYLFDFTLENVDLEHEGFDTRLHRWFLTHLYPRPNLVIFLDAPAEVLFARKGEKGIEDLEKRRQSFAQLMKTNPNCIVVDGTQPLAKVYQNVAALISRSFEAQSKSFPSRVEKSETASPVPPEQKPLPESTLSESAR